MNANGHNPSGPLHLTGPQRVAFLNKHGLTGGWILLTLAEMLEMKKAMDGSTAENVRLNGQTARILAAWIADQQKAVESLKRMKSLCDSLIASEHLPMVVTSDALTERAAVVADLAHFAAQDANATGSAKPETPNNA